MAFLFSRSSTPTKGDDSIHSRELTSSSSGGSLPAIVEDKSSFLDSWDTTPPVPPRAGNRPISNTFMPGGPPSNSSYEGSTPEFTYFASVKAEGPLAEGPETKRTPELKRQWINNEHIAKRGGWRKLAIIGAIATICILGLAIGLGVGLKKHKSSPM